MKLKILAFRRLRGPLPLPPRSQLSASLRISFMDEVWIFLAV